MKIAGFQKFTLIDYSGKIACSLFLQGCNFRCGFCHNPELVLEEPKKIYSEKEVLEFLEKRKGQVEGVCIVGGEPLMSLDLDFLKKIKNLGYLIQIDTNGSFPNKLKELIEKNLVDSIAMDIKSSKEKYLGIINSEIDLNKIEESIKLVGNFRTYEFRTTIIEGLHDAEEMKKIAVWLNEILGKKPKKICLQAFKNSGKFIDKRFQEKRDTPREYLRKLKVEIKDLFWEVDVRV